MAVCGDRVESRYKGETKGSVQAHDGASVRVAFDVPFVKGVFVCDVSACAVCRSYSSVGRHIANKAAVQGLSPCMTVLPLFLLPLCGCYASFGPFDGHGLSRDS